MSQVIPHMHMHTIIVVNNDSCISLSCAFDVYIHPMFIYVIIIYEVDFKLFLHVPEEYEKYIHTFVTCAGKKGGRC